MSDKRTQANRYAQAVLQAMVERWQTTLNQAETFAQSAQMTTLLADGNADLDTKVQAFEQALPAGTPQEAMNLIKMLVQSGDLDMLSDVSAALGKLASGQNAPTKAEVVSAIELSDAEKDAIRQKLTNEHGEGLNFSFQVDDSLMGGLRVRVGDRLVDTSVASRLSTLREILSSVGR